MADNLMIDVDENLDLEELVESLEDSFRAKGFAVTKSKMKNGVRIKFDKGCGGFNMITGLGKGITATIVKKGESLSVTYSEGDWVGKIIPFAAFLILGWALIPIILLVTAIIGTVGQLNLPKNINSEIMMLVSED